MSLVLALGKGRLFENPYLRSLGLATLLGTGFFLLLNFLGILPLSLFFSLGGGLKTGVLTTEVGFSCPVPSEFCGAGKKTVWNGNPALSYSLPQGTFVYSISQVGDSKEFSSDPFEKTKYRGVWQASQVGDDCYTATYIFPYNASVRLFRPPLEKGEKIANLSPADIPIGRELVNLVLELQKRKLEAGSNVSQSTIVPACSIGNLQPSEFGEYQVLDPAVFGELKGQ